MEIATRLAGETDRSPPSEALIEQMEALERGILSGDLLRNVARDPAHEPDEATAVQISGSPGGKVTLRMRVPGDLLLSYRQLEREGEHGGRLKILPPGSNPTWVLGRHRDRSGAWYVPSVSTGPLSEIFRALDEADVRYLRAPVPAEDFAKDEDDIENRIRPRRG